MTPAKTMTIFMLVVYLAVALYLFVNLKRLDLSLFSGIKTDSVNNVNNEGKKSQSLYKSAETKTRDVAYGKVDSILKEMNLKEEYTPKAQGSSLKTATAPVSALSSFVTDLINQDGRLCSAHDMQSYFVAR